MVFGTSINEAHAPPVLLNATFHYFLACSDAKGDMDLIRLDPPPVLSPDRWTRVKDLELAKAADAWRMQGPQIRHVIAIV